MKILLIKVLIRIFRRYSPEEKRLALAVKRIIGKWPLNIQLYTLAMKHSSISRREGTEYYNSNERLEYLGDAILGSVVADYLFQKFPYKDEGFLTEMRSRIVSRSSLNDLAMKLGLDAIVDFDQNQRYGAAVKSIYGNAFEAFVGAIYLDRGYVFCRNFIVKKILLTHIDMEEVIENDLNFKSKLIEWAQKNGKNMRFDVVAEKGKSHEKQFSINVVLDEEIISMGKGSSKKRAEQDAARKACDHLAL